MTMFIIIVVAIIIISALMICYIVFKQRKEFEYILNEDIISKTLDKETKEFSSLELISNKRFEKLLSEAIDKPNDLDILKKDIQNRLRLFMKVSDIAKARTCNEQLKKIDIASRQKGV